MTTLTITIDGVRNLVRREMTQNPHLTGRLEKAATIVLLRDIVPYQDAFLVRGEDNLSEYRVTWSDCECPDYQRYKGSHHCKHRLALAMKTVLERPGRVPETIVGWHPPALTAPSSRTSSRDAVLRSHRREDGDPEAWITRI